MSSPKTELQFNDARSSRWNLTRNLHRSILRWIPHQLLHPGILPALSWNNASSDYPPTKSHWRPQEAMTRSRSPSSTLHDTSVHSHPSAPSISQSTACILYIKTILPNSDLWAWTPGRLSRRTARRGLRSESSIKIESIIYLCQKPLIARAITTMHTQSSKPPIENKILVETLEDASSDDMAAPILFKMLLLFQMPSKLLNDSSNDDSKSTLVTILV